MIWSCHSVLINNVHTILYNGLSLGLWVMWRVSSSIKCMAFSLVLGLLPPLAATQSNGIPEDLLVQLLFGFLLFVSKSFMAESVR